MKMIIAMITTLILAIIIAMIMTSIITMIIAMITTLTIEIITTMIIAMITTLTIEIITTMIIAMITTLTIEIITTMIIAMIIRSNVLPTEAGAWEGLENNTAVNVSSQLATTAFLPCAVRMIGDKQVRGAVLLKYSATTVNKIK